MQRFTMFAALALLLIAGSPARAAGGGLQFTVHTNYYTVTGRTSVEILFSLQQNRPWKTNAPSHAITAWKVSWSGRSDRTQIGQSLQHFEVAANAVVTLPRWMPPSNAPPALVEEWQRYWKALALHEQGHVKIARDAASELQRALAALGSFPSQRELDQATTRASDKVMGPARQKEREYDRQTRHGATQGAVFH